LADKAVIWDMDGVIADTGPFHLKAWQQVFREKGLDFTEEDFKRRFGQRNDSIIRGTLGDELSQDEIEAIARKKETAFRRVARGKVAALPGAVALMQSLRQHGFKMALASSAPIGNINLVMKALGTGDYFQVVVTGRDVAEGKPSPQGFLLAAQRLVVAPQNCVVIEDAIAGVEACRRAGMHCLAVTNTHPRSRLGKAELVVDSLEHITADDLDKLIKSAKGE
jgi:beta-phosphoglucomutase family hydrolase